MLSSSSSSTYEGLLSVELTRRRVVNFGRLQQGIKGIWACLCLHYRPKAAQFAALLVPQAVGEASHSIIGKLGFLARSCHLPNFHQKCLSLSDTFTDI